jgi:hypothetical protein
LLNIELPLPNAFPRAPPFSTVYLAWRYGSSGAMQKSKERAVEFGIVFDEKAGDDCKVGSFRAKYSTFPLTICERILTQMGKGGRRKHEG